MSTAMNTDEGIGVVEGLLRVERDNRARDLFFEAWDKFGDSRRSLLMGVYDTKPQLLHPVEGQAGCYRLGQRITADLQELRYLDVDGSLAIIPQGATVIVPMVKVDDITLEAAVNRAAQMVYDHLNEGATSGICVFLMGGLTRDQVRPFAGWETCGLTFLAYSHRP